ncbi:PDDEXK family nuclease [Pseudoduganella aquatica]|uniref:TnsA endonuclease N-terminal domain-containing protein n=1 Tax=Pseudoduganella aquatica TaxID=2660641 RepID=UPI001E4B1BAA|nr:TnsA endonuclease N-terminal domain-containing protein [Pseudoduganella aquatica]
MSGASQNVGHTGHVDDLSDAVALPTEPVPKPRQKGMTYEKLCERILLGHGMGHGNGYLPWLTLRRKNPSPISNQVPSWMPPLGRPAHYFSRGEFHTALLLIWLGVKDVREQFPLWPLRHPHPLDGTHGAPDVIRPWAPGLLDIAKEAGIDHGYEIGTGLPYVASLDLLATAALPSGYKLAAFSSKPFTSANDDVKWRTLERLELERRYTARINCSYFVSSSALIPLVTAGQLEWWLDASTLHCAAHLLPNAVPFAQEINACRQLPANEAVAITARRLQLTTDEAWLLFRHCAWTQSIDIDPSVRHLSSYPIHPGGRALRDNLRRHFFGETWL